LIFFFVGCGQLTQDASLVVSFSWMTRHADRHFFGGRTFLSGHIAKAVAHGNILYISLGPYMTLIISTLGTYEEIISPPCPSKLVQIRAEFENQHLAFQEMARSRAKPLSVRQ